MYRCCLIVVVMCVIAAPSVSPAECVGDCGGDGAVTIDELLIGVNIALGRATLDACPVLDANGDGNVTIDELLQAVNAALTGCPTPTRRPTRTRRPTVTATPTETPTETPPETPTVTPTEIPTEIPTVIVSPTEPTTPATPNASESPLATITATPTVTPTCMVEAPIVDPLTSPTTNLALAISGTAHTTGAGYSIVVMGGGYTGIEEFGLDPFDGVRPFVVGVPLKLNQSQQLTVCLYTNLCGRCTRTDTHGDPLKVTQVTRVTSTPTQTATPTDTPTGPTSTPQPTPTFTPVDCGAVVPQVDPVTSPTDALTQTVTGIVYAPGPRLTIRLCSEVGCASTALPTDHATVHGFAVPVPLTANTVHHFEACAIDHLCDLMACTQTDWNGNPLTITQLLPSTPTATFTATATATPVVPTNTITQTATLTPTRNPTATCAAAAPAVDPVTSPTDKLTQLITGTAAILRAGTVLSIGGETITLPQANPSQSFALPVPLLPNQTQQFNACLRDPTCPLPVCTDVDRNGQPLQIVEVLPTPRATVPPTR